MLPAFHLHGAIYVISALAGNNVHLTIAVTNIYKSSIYGRMCFTAISPSMKAKRPWQQSFGSDGDETARHCMEVHVHDGS